MSSRTVEFRVRAIGSTDAAGRAKQTARELGYRIQTVASIRPVVPDASRGREQADWIVVLAVRNVLAVRE
jgi:hypothetical protein